MADNICDNWVENKFLHFSLSIYLSVFWTYYVGSLTLESMIKMWNDFKFIGNLIVKWEWYFHRKSPWLIRWPMTISKVFTHSLIYELNLLTGSSFWNCFIVNRIYDVFLLYFRIKEKSNWEFCWIFCGILVSRFFINFPLWISMKLIKWKNFAYHLKFGAAPLPVFSVTDLYFPSLYKSISFKLLSCWYCFIILFYLFFFLLWRSEFRTLPFLRATQVFTNDLKLFCWSTLAIH